MKRPSLTLILSGLFIAYVLHSMWTLANLFIPPKCTEEPCFPSFFNTNPTLTLNAYTSESPKTTVSGAKQILHMENFNYDVSVDKELTIDIPAKTRNNGTLYLHAVVYPTNNNAQSSKLTLGEAIRVPEASVLSMKLTRYSIPQYQAFNLLTEEIEQQHETPVTHIKKKITIIMLTDRLSLPAEGLPYEIIRLVRLNPKGEFLPIMQQDFLQTRVHDLEPIASSTYNTTILLRYNPCSAGWLRFVLQVESAMGQLLKMGFTVKDIDEVKRVFSETNVYLLCATMLIGSVHLLLDFLSFKSDVSFWKSHRSMAGLSSRTVLWRAFSQTVIFFYLLDEQTSLLVLVPSGVGTIIEFWKVKKVLKATIKWTGYLPSIQLNAARQESAAEAKTRQYDEECMKYLSYLLYPLCVVGAVYSLLFQPHKSWYSWSINSLANGVYAFGFLFMLPQLFVNYRLKSVAALPWRAFTYRAFTTFIDDIFAFIITMPTAHRLACFRDDVVFVIYLYQRRLYPVDKTRIEDTMGETTELEVKKNE
ncbi:uncharacterized protein CBL_11722 [Carabus blaptoides fortunei]